MPDSPVTIGRIENVENVVCSASTKARHPELFHYTRPAAFASIVGSNTIWCSHYRGMADLEEVELMRVLLVRALAPHFDLIVGTLTLNRAKRRLWAASGGGAKLARDLVNSLYGATFDGKAVYSRMDAFLSSFSTHADDTPFEREHGVRSQWDSYARDGYRLVLDTGELAEMLKREGEVRHWVWLQIEPVRYDGRPVEDIFPELVAGLADTLQRFLDGERTPQVAVTEFLMGATLLKGAAFSSEREVRIVAIPGTAAIARRAAREYPGEFNTEASRPQIKMTETGKRYIVLFDGLDGRLPLKRVIVGPGASQDERAERARAILPADVPITLSRYPLI